MFPSTSEALSRLLPGPTVPGFQKVKDADMVNAYQIIQLPNMDIRVLINVFS